MSQRALDEWVTLPMVYSLFRTIDEQGVAWCVVRDPSDIAHGDLDLLVARNDFGRLEGILRQHGFVRLARGPGTHVSFVTYDALGDRWIRLDVVTDLSFGPGRLLRTHAEAACLARRRRDGAVARLSLEDEFWALLLHCMLDKGTIAPRHQERLQELAGAAPVHGEWGRLLEQLCPAGWTAGGMIQGVRQGQWAQLKGLALPLSLAWMRHQRIGLRWRALVDRALQRADQIVTLLRRPGVTVALLGADGAGKSTLSEGIRKSSPLPVRVVYMGFQRHRPAARRPLVPGLGLANNLLYQWRGCLPGVVHRRRGRVVIFDRYSYDVLTLEDPEGWRKRMSRWLMAYSCPPPNVVVLLDAPPEMLRERKGEHDLARTIDLRERYLDVAKNLRRVVVVDASRDGEEVRRHVTSLIWRAYAGRRTA